MTISLNGFIEKYKLNDFNKPLELSGRDKIDFLNDLNNIMKSISNLFDKLANINSIREGLALIAIAKLQKLDAVTLKKNVMDCLLIDRYDAINRAFENLEKQNYIKLEEIARAHRIKLNENDFPDFAILREIIQQYWESPEEVKNKMKKWSGVE